MSSGSGGALGSGNQLTADREFRYIVQWFSEWSDFQREDFVPVMAAYLANGGATGGIDSGGTTAKSPPYINGIIGGMANLSGQDKPMSLFQCRVKLFNEWSSKWPETHRSKLLERLTELDASFGSQVHRELSGEPRTTTPNPSSSDDPEEFGDPGSAENSLYYQQQLQQQQQRQLAESQSSPEPTTTTAATTIAPATIALVIAED